VRIDKDTNIRLLENLKQSSSVKTKNEIQAAAPKTVDTVDKVELSTSKEEVARLKEKIKSIPDVDMAKVTQTQNALQAETYNPNGQLVARKIIQSHLLDEIL
jgi:flagellar biosynthesis anti-sigma factor FlgM